MPGIFNQAGCCCAPPDPCEHCDADTTPRKVKVVFSGVDAGACACTADAGPPPTSFIVTSLSLDGTYCLTKAPLACLWQLLGVGSWSLDLFFNTAVCGGAPLESPSGNFNIFAQRTNATTWSVSAALNVLSGTATGLAFGGTNIGLTNCLTPFVVNNALPCLLTFLTRFYQISTTGTATVTPDGC